MRATPSTPSTPCANRADEYPARETHLDHRGAGTGMNPPEPAMSLPALAAAAPRPGLLGRRAEREALDRLVAGVQAGHSQVLVLRGEAGSGKTALLDYLLERASACRIARAAGIESEQGLAFAGLHQLCGPFLNRIDHLPGPQRDALGTAFGRRGGPAPDRFLAGLAVASLLSAAAADRPLLCVVDDAQWLDRATAQALAFVARHLVAEPVAVVIATRPAAGEPGSSEPDLAGLTGLSVGGLGGADARSLLESAVPGRLDERVRDRIIAETRGNPGALLELARADLAGGFGLPGATAVSGCIEESFRRRLAPLPAATRRLLLLAAADPAGDPILVWRAAGHFDVAADAAAAAAAAACSSRAGRCGSATRWPGTRPTGPPHRPSARPPTTRWPRPPIPLLIPTAAPGTTPTPSTGWTRTPPPGSSARRRGRRLAAAWPPSPRSASAPPS